MLLVNVQTFHLISKTSTDPWSLNDYPVLGFKTPSYTETYKSTFESQSQNLSFVVCDSKLIIQWVFL